ncbi:hypothetical protein JOF56_009117 [Kibdelosporangium banguiense]|uniref:Uncharacterized protein n=1 Tax=Kibdelosporangium banguiense TaxID=1365924 RepID=A0ABS4TWE2_9PSEU|nr:hypothetical protein [Kibdelosporangium banguiense]
MKIRRRFVLALVAVFIAAVAVTITSGTASATDGTIIVED